MNTLAQAGQFQTLYSSSYLSARPEAEPVAEPAEKSKAAPQVQASQSVTVSLGGTTRSSYTYLSSGLPSAASKNHGLEQSQALAPKSTANNPAAENILGFISKRLEEDLQSGASQEELSSRLQAAYDGFVQGYGQAFDELSAAGLLTPEIETAISQTFSAMMEGFDQLAEQYGVASPVADSAPVSDSPEVPASPSAAPASPTQSVNFVQSSKQSLSSSALMSSLVGSLPKPGDELKTLLEAGEINYEAFAARNFSFELKTRDGDVVKITASANYSEQAQVRAGSINGGSFAYNATQVKAASASSNQFGLSVEGELDEDELRAINDLLGQVGDLSQTFYSGNIEEAFQMALDIGFDETEIARFSLNLRQEVSTKVESTYSAVQNMAEPDTAGKAPGFNKDDYRFTQGNLSIARMQAFVAMLSETSQFAENLGVKKSSLPGLGELVAASQGKDKTEADAFSRFMEKLLAEV